jgi:hypothetical protein
MASRYQIGGWPRRPNVYGNVAQVHAIGQITLAYNWLEEGLDYIFQICMPVEKEFSQRLFHKMNNRDRIDLLSAIVKSSRFHADAKDRLNYLIQCYDICTENRNILLHASFQEAYAGVLHLAKRSKNDPIKRNRFKIPLADLRRVAEEMHELYSFTLDLMVWLQFRKAFHSKYRNSLKIPPLNEIPYPKMRHVLEAVPDFGTTLPQKPRKPHKLTPSQTSAIPLIVKS